MNKQWFFKKIHQALAVLFVVALQQFVVYTTVVAQTTEESPPPVTSETSDETNSRVGELKQSIASHEDEIKKLEAEIADFKVRINNVGNQKKTLQSAIQTVDLTRAKLAKDSELTQAKIARTNATISALGRTIADKEALIVKNKKVIANIIHQINEADNNSFLEMMLANVRISDFLLDIENLNQLQVSVGDGIKSLERLKTDLGKQKEQSQATQKELVRLRGQLLDQKKLADQQRQEQASLLKETKNQESNYKKLLADREARKKQFEREIEDFEAQLRAEIDPTTFPAAGTKVLAYPVSDPLITQKFGKTIDAKRLYTSGTHSGMDFRASPGTPIRAAGDGVVVATGDTDRACRGASYGRWVMIKHQNGLSTMYAHLELIKVSAGDTVNVGDVIGYSGSTGYATGPHLHFAVFVTNVVQIVDLPSKSCAKAVFHIPVAPTKGYLDPQDYL